MRARAPASLERQAKHDSALRRNNMSFSAGTACACTRVRIHMNRVVVHDTLLRQIAGASCKQSLLQTLTVSLQLESPEPHASRYSKTVVCVMTSGVGDLSASDSVGGTSRQPLHSLLRHPPPGSAWQGAPPSAEAARQVGGPLLPA